MANPFEKRATEYLVDTEAFLSVVTPEPMINFFQKNAKDGSLYDRLTVVTGTPGSGKTTIARLFEFATVRSLLRNRNATTYRSLADALTQCRVLDDLAPQVIGARVPLESEYREFWEFPYSEDLRVSLTTALLQARAMIRWLRQIGDAGVDLDLVTLVARPGAEAALDQIGGSNASDGLARAREVELAIYKIVRALVPPPSESLREQFSGAYHPFDVLQSIRFNLDGAMINAQPLVMFDDAHSLHPVQYERLERWLSQREMRVGRWILTRLDALMPSHVLGGGVDTGFQKTRVVTEIRMQAGDRSHSRTAFRRMARDMSGRYLRQMDTFNRRQLTDLPDLLSTSETSISDGKFKELKARVDTIQRRVGASHSRRLELEFLVDAYFESSTSYVRTPELALAAIAIALERYGKRVPQLALDFDNDLDDIEPNKPITIDSSLIDGARIRLLHDVNLPYYFGFDALCDASTENAEQFLQLASRLVSQSEIQLVRRKAPSISPSEQNKLIRKRACELIDAWDFPLHREVRRLTDVMARQCVEKSLQGNAPLGGGANAWGIPQEQFNQLATTEPKVARVLQFAVAYNAIVLKPGHLTKKRVWCLVELAGPLVVRHGLTLKRGGFLEREVKDIAAAVEGSQRA